MNRLSLMARDYRYFEIAKRAALTSDFKTKLGAIAVYQGKVIASAASSSKTHSLQAKYNRYRNFDINNSDCLPKVHAEIKLISKLKKMQNIDFKRVSVYIYRVCKSRDRGMARPCGACRAALKDMGIISIFYSTDDPGYACELLESRKEG